MATAKPATKAVAKSTKATKPARVPLATMRSKMVAASVPEEAKVAAAPVAATEPAPWDDEPTPIAQTKETPPVLQQAQETLAALASIGIHPQVDTPAPVAAPQPTATPAADNDPINHPMFANMNRAFQPTLTKPVQEQNNGAIFSGNSSGLGTVYGNQATAASKPEPKKNTTAFFSSNSSPL